MEFLLDFILHIDQYMIDIVQEYHMWAYVILFLLIVVIIMVSILPAVVEVLRARLKQRKQNKLIYLVHLSIMKNSFLAGSHRKNRNSFLC